MLTLWIVWSAMGGGEEEGSVSIATVDLLIVVEISSLVNLGTAV